jgi:hypothetical protein
MSWFDVVTRCSYVRLQVLTAASMNMTALALMMEAVRSSETSVYSEIIRRYIPEGSHLQDTLT